MILSTITGLRLHPLAPEQDSSHDESDVEVKEEKNEPSTSSTNNKEDDKEKSKKEMCEIDPRCKIEVRKWKQGSYTLLNDDKTSNDKYCLEGRLFFNSQDWNIECGGFTSYVAKDEDEELLTALPENNTLQLIYKDKQTLGFVKYVNDGINALPNGEFHDISVSYYE